MLVLNLPFKALMFLTLMRPSLVLFLVLWLKLVKDFLKVRCRLALLPFLISCLIWLDLVASLDIFTFYVPHRHVYGEQWIKFMKDGVNATPLPTVNTTGYIDHAAFLGTINPDTNKIPKHLF